MTNSKKVIVLGGGLTGLAAAWKLAKSGTKVTVIEARDAIGGLASSFTWRGFELDIGPHKLCAQSDDIRDFIVSILGEDLENHRKRASIWFRGERLVFPPTMKSGTTHLGLLFAGLYGYLTASISTRVKTKPETSYEDYVINRFGRHLYEEVFRPQAQKLWGRPAELSSELGRIRLPFPNLFQAIFSALLKGKRKERASVKEFLYPKQGIGALADSLAKDLIDCGGQILTGQKPAVIHLSNDGVEVDLDSTKLLADVVISTIAPDSFVRILRPKVPEEILKAAEGLRFRSLIMCYLALSKPRLSADHWINFPEEAYCFNRIYEPRAFGVKGDNPNETIIAAEVTVDAQDLQSREDVEIVDSVVSDLVSSELIKAEDVLDHKIVRIKRAYPLLDIGYEARRGRVLSYIHKQPNILCAGRSGLFIYNNMDHSLDMGLAAAGHILNDNIESWPIDAAARFEGNRIID